MFYIKMFRITPEDHIYNYFSYQWTIFLDHFCSWIIDLSLMSSYDKMVITLTLK